MKKLNLCILALLMLFNLKAQVEPSSDLYKTILSKDSLLFDVGFNTCDIHQFETLLSEKFEFFHDKDNMSFKADFLRNLRNGLCIAPDKYQSRRELVKESTQVYPLFKNKKLYGAIQNGMHRFYETVAGQKEKFASTAKFTHVWVLENGEWRLNKSLSFDHQNANDKRENVVIDNSITLNSQNALFKIDSILQQAYATKALNGTILIAKDGKTVFNKSFGYADFEKKTPLSKNSQFQIASVSKQFTAFGIMVLKRQGKLKYDDKVLQFLPDFPYPNITLRHLMHHSAGLPNFWDAIRPNLDTTRSNGNNDVLAYLAKHKLPLRFEAGEKWEYADIGYDILATVIERVSGETYEKFLRKAVFRPAGMHNTEGVLVTDIRRIKAKNLARGYFRDSLKGLELAHEARNFVFYLGDFYGDGSVISTAEDLKKWDDAWRGFMREDAVHFGEAYQKPLRKDGSILEVRKGVSYGFGWALREDPAMGKFYSHTGGHPGFTTYFNRYPDKNTVLVVCLNVSSYASFSPYLKALQDLMPALSEPQNIDNQLYTVVLYDKSRDRQIPVAIYQSKKQTPKEKQKLVIFSHGYGQNKGGDYLAYSYLTDYLAAKGYCVASIQHELPTDSLLPLTGNLQIVRRPFWERGADNILFVINSLKKSHPHLDFEHITLIGHSNGGDMTALFPQKYPNIVDKITTLDNRRMALPKTDKVKVYSLRSSDQMADEGVLPTEEEAKKWGMTLIKLQNVKHNDMDDNATEAQRAIIRQHILAFLQ